MRKLFLSSALVFALIGCGGSSNKITESTEKDYKGAITKGDYVTFTFDSSTNKLSYKVDDDAPFFGGEKGTVKLSNPYGKFYTSSSLGASAMIANNLLISKISIDSNNVYAIGLESSSTPTIEKVAGDGHKDYVYAHINGDNISIHTLTINKNGTYTQKNLTTDVTSIGCWKIDNERLMAKAGVNDCTNVTDFDFNIVIKPGNSRAAIVVDDANGNGVGIGLEQRKLQNSDVSGTYYSYYFETNDEDFANVEIDSNGNVKWKSCPGGSCTSQYASGTLLLNQDCNGDTINGIACANIGGNEYLTFIDNDDDYYFAVSASETPFHVEVGAK